MNAGLFRVSGEGGKPEPLTTPDDVESSHVWPSVIPGTRAVVFVLATTDVLATGRLAVLDLDTTEITPLGVSGVSPHYIATGHLVYVAPDATVQAVPFDVSSLEVTGNPVSLIEDVWVTRRGAANFSFSDNGRLVYGLGGHGGSVQRSLVWVDRQGREEPIAVSAGAYTYPRISPDGGRVKLDSRDQQNDILVWDFRGEILTQVTNPDNAGRSDDMLIMRGVNEYGHWTPDGQWIIFSSNRYGPLDIYRTAADGTEPVERLTQSDARLRVNGVTRDGHVIARASVPGRQSDLRTVELGGEHPIETWLGTEFDERNAALAPNGAWLAYESNVSGQYEVYVRPFPDADGQRRLISGTGGGRTPV